MNMARRRWFGHCYLVCCFLAVPGVGFCAGPATVDEAAKVLDLRTFPLLEQGTAEHKSLGMLRYEALADAKAAFEFQRRQLTQRGWKELPGSTLDKSASMGQFTKDSFGLAVSTYPLMGDPKKEGYSSITLVNHGNVDLSKLPIPPQTKPFYSSGGEASYLCDASVAEVAKACRELLTKAGWEPYGSASSDPNSPMDYFKRNAVRIQCWVSTAPAQGNKTILKYHSELLSADLPFPPDAPDPRYSDLDKSMRYDYPGEEIAPVVNFYQQKLTAMGWKATTERPITDDRSKTAFLIFGNSQKDLLSLDMEHYTGIVRVKLWHQTREEVVQEEERMHAEQAKRAAEVARKEAAKTEEKPRKTVAQKATGGKTPNIRDLPGMENLPADVELPNMPELGNALEALKRAEKMAKEHPASNPRNPLPTQGLEAIANLLSEDEAEATPKWEYKLPKLSPQEMKQTGVKLTIAGKTYALDYGIGYQVSYINELATEITLTTKPLSLEQIVADLNAGKEGSDSVSFDTRLVLRYDPSGQICGMNLYADGLSVSVAGSGGGVVTSPLTLEKGRAKNSASIAKTKSVSEKEYEFTAPFDVPVIMAQRRSK
jgi:hypothetical protein